MKTSYRIIALFVSFIVIIISIFISNELKPNDKTLINYVTLFGTALSFIGILLTFLQINSVKATTEATKKEISETVQKLNIILTIFDTTKALQFIQMSQGYLRDNKFEMAYSKMKDLKEFLIEISYLHSKNIYVMSESFQYSYEEFMIDLNNVSLVLEKTSKKINNSEIIDNLERLSTELTRLGSSIKYKEIYGQ